MRPDAVIKVGGSLLDWPGLPGRLTSYLGSRSGERLLLLAGGGPAADHVRALDSVHRLGDESAHVLALRALDLTAHLLAALVPGLQVVDETAECARLWEEGRTPVLAPRRFLDADDHTSADPLPHSWNVTSDAIAARVAARLKARELVLLKSAPLPRDSSRASAARMGLVDSVFPWAARYLTRVLYVNLRDPSALPVPLDRPLDDGSSPR